MDGFAGAGVVSGLVEGQTGGQVDRRSAAFSAWEGLGAPRVPMAVRSWAQMLGRRCGRGRRRPGDVDRMGMGEPRRWANGNANENWVLGKGMEVEIEMEMEMARMRPPPAQDTYRPALSVLPPLSARLS